jgi:hypothetical protein
MRVKNQSTTIRQSLSRSHKDEDGDPGMAIGIVAEGIRDEEP